MYEQQAVQTGSKAESCRHCGATLPKRPSAKEHHFCGPKCRAAWHREQKQFALNKALSLVVGVEQHLDGDLRAELVRACHYLLAAGAEPA